MSGLAGRLLTYLSKCEMLFLAGKLMYVGFWSAIVM